MRALSLNRRYFLLGTMGVVMVIVFLYLFIDLGKTLEVMSQANYALVGAGLLFVLGGVFLYGAAWDMVLRAMSAPLGLWKAFKVAFASIFLSIVMPMGTISGESLRCYLAVKNSTSSTGNVFASVLGHRTIDMTAFLGVSIFGLVYMLRMHEFLNYTIYAVSLVILLVSVAISLVLYVIVRPQQTARILDALFRLVGRLYRRKDKLEDWKQKAVVEAGRFHKGIDKLTKKPFHVVYAVTLSTISVICDLLATRLVFGSLGLDVPLGIITTAYVVSIAIQTIPVGLPGMVGPVEVSMITIYAAAGLSAVTAAAATLILRSLSLIMQIVLGGLSAYSSGIDVLKYKERAMFFDEHPMP